MAGADLRRLTAAVLAGGLGTRLRSVLEERPKVLAPVGGRPFLAYLLERLARAGLERVVLCTGFGAEQVQREFGERLGPLQLVHSREPEPLGTGGALRLALPHLDSANVLVLNGDSLCDVELERFLDGHTARGAEVSVVVTEVADPGRYGTVRLDAQGRITAFDEKSAQASPGPINGGVYLIQRRRLEAIPFGRAVSLERELLPEWVRAGVVYGFRGGPRFLDIGTPQSYAAAEHFLGGETAREARRHWVILDRDGTLIRERHYLSDPRQVELIPGVAPALSRLRQRGLGTVVVTNQSAVGRGLLDGPGLDAVHERLRDLLAAQGVALDAIFACPHLPTDDCPCRKPRPGMVDRARRELGLDPRASFVVGDKDCDVELGRNVGATTFLVQTGYGAETARRGDARPDHVVRDLAEAAQVIERLLARRAEDSGDALES